MQVPEKKKEKKKDQEEQVIAIRHSRDEPTMKGEEDEIMAEDEASECMMMEICGTITDNKLKFRFKQLSQEHQSN